MPTAGVSLVKRLIDLAGASVGIAVTLPLYPAVAIAIYLDDPGPVFYAQRRAGRLLDAGPRGLHFETFSMFKFRTMRIDAEAKTGAVVAGENDPRVTRLGRFLRRTRIDELPQLFNVLRGEMSLVGPRPERPELLETLAAAIPFFEERMRGVKPGLTGLAQVTLGYTGRPPPGSLLHHLKDDLVNPFDLEGVEGALADDMRLKLLVDLAYGATLEHFGSFVRTELEILLRTPLVMLTGRGR
ncbi:MAG: sugar transferase [Deltaproteobacteria bacterium]|nr:sugar transferase [Deltaproteobacteria bacterium]